MFGGLFVSVQSPTKTLVQSHAIFSVLRDSSPNTVNTSHHTVKFRK